MLGDSVKVASNVSQEKETFIMEICRVNIESVDYFSNIY